MKLRPYQQAAVDSLYSYWGQFGGHPLIVVPTAGGKSAIQGGFIKSIYDFYPQANQKILLLTHVKELLEQNFEKIQKFWPDAPVGLYSAGLNRRDTMFPITVAGIQSIYKNAHLFGFVDLIGIDEAHLLNPDDDTMYKRFINDLMAYNPNLKIFGMTATPFRMKGGMLTHGDNRIFTDISYEITINYLLGDNPEKRQYIANLISKSAVVQANLEGVRTQAGDFNQKQAEAAMDQDPLTEAALDEVFTLADNRKAWLVFCQGVKHAEHVRDSIRRRGVSCEMITGETDAWERERIIKDLREGRLQCVTNNNVLTTGFDAPNIDLIITLRATQSVGLWMQMLGRGMRLNGQSLEESVANGKENCLVLDFAGNMERFGPINMIEVRNPRPKEHKICPQCRSPVIETARVCPDCMYEFYEEPKKYCPNCGAGLPIATRVCHGKVYICNPCYDKYAVLYPEEADAKAAGKQYWIYSLPEKFKPEEDRCPTCAGEVKPMNFECGFEYPDPEVVHHTTASEGVLIAEAEPIVQTVEVDWVDYKLHEKEGKPLMLKVTHYSGLNQRYMEWVLLEHTGYPRAKATRWWNQRRKANTPPNVPDTVDEALARLDELREPASISVKKNGKFWEIQSIDAWKPDIPLPPAPAAPVLYESDIPF